ncbi:MAG: polynucleotide adenylyltransferase [Puniceicoccales bacterium]|nr:polynucleotide adenylyltransferase [Puniceicoccales bacterium]
MPFRPSSSTNTMKVLPPVLPAPSADKIGEICRKIHNAGGKAYLVGGCVRDMLLGMEVYEWDLEVFSIGGDDLEKLFPDALDFVGKCYGIYRFKNLPIDLGLPRDERPTGAKHREFSVAVDPAMSIVDAALRRDFTVNAIYWDPLENVIVDPFAGVGDLEKGVLRHVSERFSEDPLRVLRAMQFVGRFSFSVDEKTVELCRALDGQHLSGERIGGEFNKLILLGKAIGAGLEFLRSCSWLRFFPELAALVDCKQDATFHPEGSVWEHVKLAMDVFASRRPLEKFDALAIGLTVLCHDFGKPATYVLCEDGRMRAHGHGEAGVPLAKNFLGRMRVANELVETILPLIDAHMLPRGFSNPKVATVGAVRRLAWKVKRIDLLLAVARCDNLGRALPSYDLSGEDRLEEMARAEGVLHSPPEPILRGRDLLAAFELEQSPFVGVILGKLFEMQLDGHLSSREEALAAAELLIKKMSASHSS